MAQHTCLHSSALQNNKCEVIHLSPMQVFHTECLSKTFNQTMRSILQEINSSVGRVFFFTSAYSVFHTPETSQSGQDKSRLAQSGLQFVCVPPSDKRVSIKPATHLRHSYLNASQSVMPVSECHRQQRLSLNASQSVTPVSECHRQQSLSLNASQSAMPVPERLTVSLNALLFFNKQKLKLCSV